MPIPSDPNSIFRRLLIKNYNAKVRTEKMKGEFVHLSIQNEAKRKKNFVTKLHDFSRRNQFFTLDSMHSSRMIPAIKRIERNAVNDNIYIALISHPKLLDDGLLANIERVVAAFKNDPEVRFINMTDIYTELGSMR